LRTDEEADMNPVDWDWIAVSAAASNWATAIGLPVAIVVYWLQHRRDRVQRELETFSSVGSDYLQYLHTCLDHPIASIYAHQGSCGPLSKDQVREALLFEILICNLEAAFFRYRDQSTDLKRRQWKGWERYVRDWCETQWFQDHWTGFEDSYDIEFGDSVTRLLNEVKATPAAPVSEGTHRPAEAGRGDRHDAAE
jgi:hypothetical protein